MPRYDDDDDIDADADERYRRRARRYGREQPTDEEREAEENDRAEGAAVARRKCVPPGVLMAVAGVAGIAGNVVFGVLNAPTAGGGPGGAVTMVCFTMQWGIALALGGLVSVMQVVSGVFLVRRRLRGLVFTGMILGCLPLTFTAPLGWVAAVWTFLVLQDPDVSDAFERGRA